MNIFETQLLANQIAQQFILSNADLSEGIAKCASEKDLSRIQIQGLVSATNHIANEYLRKTADDKTFTFEVADLDKVLELLDDVAPRGADITKVASAIRSLNKDSGRIEAMYKQAQFGSSDDQERRCKEAKQYLTKIAALAAAYAREAEAEKVAMLSTLDSQINQLTQEVKNYLVQTSAGFGDIRKFASAVRVENPRTTEVVMRRVEGKLEKLGEPFTGLLAQGRELTQETFKRSGGAVPEPEVTIVNGNVPMQRTLQQIDASVRGISQKALLTHELHSLNSAAAIAERSFIDSKSVDKYLIHELDTFYKGLVDDCHNNSMQKLAGIVKMVGKGLVKGVKASPRAALAGAKAMPAVALAGATSTGLKALGAGGKRASEGLAYAGKKGESGMKTLQ